MITQITELNSQIYFFAGIVEMMFFLPIGISSFLPGLDRGTKHYFISFCSIILLELFVFVLDMMNLMRLKVLAVSSVMVFFEYVLFSLLPVLLTAYLLYCSGEDWRHSTLFRATAVLWGVFFVVLVIAQFTDGFYYLSADLVFYRGAWHPLLLAPPAAIMLVTLAALLLRRGKLSRKYFYAFLIHTTSIAIVTVLLAFYDILPVLNIGIWISTLVTQILILSEQIEQHVRQQTDLANQKVRIMMLQMRPHFIFNTMTSVYYLCEQDSQKAQQVILDFTSYLRKVFSSMASEDMIPFRDELEHVRAYLAVENAQFEDSLSVDYDILHTEFRLPPLTLQPLVENAIKHGMDPDSGPLHILIHTRRTDLGSVIIVKDNGPGFDAETVLRSRNTLSNIEERLAMICGGKMAITVPEEGGTVVEIEIPRK